MQYLDKLFRWGRRDSLLSRVRSAQAILVVLMLVPALVSISLMVVFSNQYHQVIQHMKRVNALRPLIQDELLIGMSDIVVGRTRFEDGKQYDLLATAFGELDALIQSDTGSRVQLEVAKRTLSTLAHYIDRMGEQIARSGPVDDNMKLMDDIREVGKQLVDEMLQNVISADIMSVSQASDRMQAVIYSTLAFEIGLLIVTLVFAMLAQQSLARSIQTPIERLKRFAARIASGELKERAEQPEVEELKGLTSSLNTMAEHLERLIQENIEEQQNLKKSELRALQAQITPHFLYNTLDAIIWLAESRKHAEVVSITSALSDFFRTSLANGRDWITIAQEKEHLLGYLTIQRVRYRDILKFEIEVDERLQDQIILKLMIQPLVENAIYHGIKNKRGGGMVRVDIAREAGMIRVSVADTGAGMDEARLAMVRRSLSGDEPLMSESGYGLYNVDQRIKLYYNQSAGLVVSSELGKGTTVSFRVPVREA